MISETSSSTAITNSNQLHCQHRSVSGRRFCRMAISDTDSGLDPDSDSGADADTESGSDPDTETDQDPDSANTWDPSIPEPDPKKKPS